MSEHRKILIAGSGPAGLTAALYSARAQLSPLVVEGELSSTSDQPGGQLMLTTEVENYPGFPEGVQGPDLMGLIREQAIRFGAEIKSAKVTKVTLEKSPFPVWTSVGKGHDSDPTYLVDAFIVATGARSLMLEVPGEDRLLGHGVSTCATCDGFFFRSKEIAVVGGGDSALEEALFLTRFASKVTLIHRREELRASRIMQERAKANPLISFRWNSVVTEAHGEEKLVGLTLKDTKTGEEDKLDVSGVFVAIGHLPNTELFDGQLSFDENGYIQTKGKSSITEIEGVFACGDVQDHVYRQAITSAGSGCTAAIDAERWLETRGA